MKNKIFIMGIFVFVVFFLIFYPKFISIADEGSYLKTTYYMSKGKLIIEDVLDSSAYYDIKNKFVPSYQPGNSIIILPFALVNWKLIFLSGLILHLLNSYIFIKILKEYKLNKIYSLLYLLYPGYIFYSRTIMSEIPSITFILLGFYFYLNYDKKYSKKLVLISGFMWGISCLIRPSNALVILGISIPLVYESIKETIKRKKILNKHSNKLISIIIGVIPTLILIFAFNYLVYGGIFNSRYSGVGGGTEIYYGLISISLSTLSIYLKPIIIMLIVYPLMLISPLFTKFKKKNEIIWIMLLFIILLGKIDVIRYNWIINLIIGHRFFFPIIPLILIPYSLFLDKYFKKLVTLFMIFLIIITPLLMFKQDQYTDEKYNIMREIYDIIPEKSIIVMKGNPLYLNNYFDKTCRSITFDRFKRLAYDGEYYLVSYINIVLLTNLNKKKDIRGIEDTEEYFKYFIKSKNIPIIYENKNNNLEIYHNKIKGEHE